MGETECDTSVACLSSAFIHPNEVEHFIGESTCIICLESFKGSAITITRCGHIYHSRCLNRSIGNACPQCRQSIDDPSVEPVPESQPELPSQEFLTALLMALSAVQPGS